MKSGRRAPSGLPPGAKAVLVVVVPLIGLLLLPITAGLVVGLVFTLAGTVGLDANGFEVGGVRMGRPSGGSGEAPVK